MDKSTSIINDWKEFVVHLRATLLAPNYGDTSGVLARLDFSASDLPTHVITLYQLEIAK